MLLLGRLVMMRDGTTLLRDSVFATVTFAMLRLINNICCPRTHITGEQKQYNHCPADGLLVSAKVCQHKVSIAQVL